VGAGKNLFVNPVTRKTGLVVPCPENQGSVQAIATAAQGLVVDPVPLRRKEMMAEIDRMVRKLYGMPKS